MSDIDTFQPKNDDVALSFLNKDQIYSPEERDQKRQAQINALGERNKRLGVIPPDLKTIAVAADGSISLVRIGSKEEGIYFIQDGERLVRYGDSDETALPRLKNRVDPLIKEAESTGRKIETEELNKSKTDPLMIPEGLDEKTKLDDTPLIDKDAAIPDFIEVVSPKEAAEYTMEISRKAADRQKESLKRRFSRRQIAGAIKYGNWSEVQDNDDLTAGDAVDIIKKRNEINEQIESNKILRIVNNAVRGLEQEKYEKILSSYLQKSQHILEAAKELKRWDLVSFMPELELQDAMEILEKKNESPYSTWGSYEDIKEQRKHELETGLFGRISDPEITVEHILNVVNKYNELQSKAD